jgi:hypothetical protein
MGLWVTVKKIFPRKNTVTPRYASGNSIFLGMIFLLLPTNSCVIYTVLGLAIICHFAKNIMWSGHCILPNTKFLRLESKAILSSTDICLTTVYLTNRIRNCAIMTSPHSVAYCNILFTHCRLLLQKQRLHISDLPMILTRPESVCFFTEPDGYNRWFNLRYS